MTNKSLIAEQKAAAASGKLAEMLLRRWGPDSDPRIREALRDGPDAFRKRVRERVLAEYGDQVFVNRCSVCERIVATPQARQCLWCGHDWHREE